VDVKQSIEEFVKKQEDFLKKKFQNQEKLTKLIVSKEASHEPKINKKSKELAMRSIEGRGADEEVHERLFKAREGDKSLRRSRSRGKSIGDLTVATVKSQGQKFQTIEEQSMHVSKLYKPEKKERQS
jgi:hypothetical protein